MNESCQSSITQYESGSEWLVALHEIAASTFYGRRCRWRTRGRFGLMAPDSTVRTALLLAAGRGKRLRPHTDSVPKPMLPWKGRPTLDHLAEAPVLLSATDYLVGPPFYCEFFESHAGHDAASSVSLKHLPGHELAARSSIRFAASGADILEIVEKPPPGTAPSAIGANLIFVLPPAVIARVGEVSASSRGEREVQTALNACLDGGGRCRGLIQGVPKEWLDGLS